MPNSSANKSRVLKAIIYLHWAAPVGYILALAGLYNLPWPVATAILFNIYYIARSGLNIWVGWVLYQSKPWAWQLFLSNACLMVVEQFYFGLFKSDTHLVFPSIIVAITAIAIAIFLVKIEFRVPYFSPQIAWWESDPRYRISVPVQVSANETSNSGEIMDISASGCFVKTKSGAPIDELVSLKFSIFENSFSCKGKVVWNTEAALTHPKGIGVRFYDMPKEDYILLKETVKKLHGVSKKLLQERREERVSTIEQKIKASIDDKH